jgi:hypothetical protein
MLEVDLHLAGDLPLAAGGGDEELHQLQQRPVPVHLKRTQSLRSFHTTGRYGSAWLCRIPALRIQIWDLDHPPHIFGELRNNFLGYEYRYFYSLPID